MDGRANPRRIQSEGR